MKRLVLTAVLVLALAGATAGCAVPRDGEARAIDPARLSTSAGDKVNCTTPGVDVENTTLRLFLVNQQSEPQPPFVTPVDRIIVNQEATPFTALNALFTCRITEEDRRRNLATFVPEQMRLAGVDPVAGQPGVYEVRLATVRNRGQSVDDHLDKVAVAQIFFTAADDMLTAPVSGLMFTLEGRAIAVTTDRREVGPNDIVRREDFGGSSPTTSVLTAVTTVTAMPARERAPEPAP